MTMDLVTALSEASEPAVARDVLKQIKNNMIGHDMAKELYIELRIFDSLSTILARRGEKGVKNEWDEARVEAGVVVGSLAFGGEENIIHLLSSNVLLESVASLDPETNPPKLILASLRTLNTMLDTYISPSAAKKPITEVPAAVYTPEVLKYFRRILSQEQPDTVVQQQIALAASVFAKSVVVEAPGYDSCEITRKRQQQVVDAGILNVLATRVASFYVNDRKGYLKPENMDIIPQQSRPTAKLAPILNAVAAIIQGSQLHSVEFLFSPTLMALFPPKDSKSSISIVSEGYAAAMETYMPFQRVSVSGRLQAPSRIITPSEFQPLSAPNPGSEFPTLAQSQSLFPVVGQSSRGGLSFNPSADDDMEGSGEERQEEQKEELLGIEETEFMLHLMSQVQTGDAMTRLAAANVLTNLHQNGLLNKMLNQLLQLLVVPVVVRLLDANEPRALMGTGGSTVGGVDAPTWNRWQIQEMAPAILARLTVDDQKLRKVAVEGEAIEKLSKILAATCDSIPADIDLQRPSKQAAPGYNHRQKVKDAVLRAIANIALDDERFKKMVIDKKIVKLVRDHCLRSLETCPGASPFDPPNGIKSEPNTAPVLISACSLIRSTSRSIYILRTELIDVKVGVPVFNLLYHPEIQVRNAAVAVLINLVLEFSPMREDIIQAGAIPKLCELAKSDDRTMQRDALWAIKHMVHKSPFPEKDEVLKSLGKEFLLSLISHSWFDDHRPVNGDDELMEDVDDAGSDTPRASAVNSSAHSPTTATAPSSNFPSSIQLPPRAAQLVAEIRHTHVRDPELEYRNHLWSLQNLGYGLLSNLMCPTQDRRAGASDSPSVPPPHIVDYVLGFVGGSESFLSLVAQTLKAGAANASSAHTAPPEVIESAMTFVSNYTACGTSQHRTVAVNNAPLMEAMKNLHDFDRPDVRTQLCWALINLISLEDSEVGDRILFDEIKHRADKLNEIGWIDILHKLKHDGARDVQERVKTALKHFEEISSPRA
ncbi:ARM repeat-containing protein [Ascodesmis nigricans]|uniref:ARM repeat-containing protein n=1 Tax=Ascodesmis nigricans TaxID=341454 RepID=A0A4V3SI24_9PEZI|nr:ARM repeat-containing protein [Ascodesmis nigricans]